MQKFVLVAEENKKLQGVLQAKSQKHSNDVKSLKEKIYTAHSNSLPTKHTHPVDFFFLTRAVIEVERCSQGLLSWFHSGDDNNAPLFHLYILRNWSVVRNNHRLKTMEDAFVL